MIYEMQDSKFSTYVSRYTLSSQYGMQVCQWFPDVAPTDPCKAGIACKFVPALIEHLGVEVRPLVGGIEYVSGQLVGQALCGERWVMCGKSECDNG